MFYSLDLVSVLLMQQWHICAICYFIGPYWLYILNSFLLYV